MLTMLDLGQPHWSMDTGGFGGHPDPENYARWMQFASVVPIMRVHSTFDEHRQPWVYGPVAEAAATQAINFRYSLIPSLYSWEHEASDTGVGVVRPMFWEFPNDPRCANESSEWMLGEQLLAAPIVDKGATSKTIYLPAGHWFDYNTDKPFDGGQEVTLPVDVEKWLDLPLFVRGGSIVATQSPLQYDGEHPVDQIVLDVWPDADRPAHFIFFDDDGRTYRYEKSLAFAQEITATQKDGEVTIDFGAGHGLFKKIPKTYLVRVHNTTGTATTFRSRPVEFTRTPKSLDITLPTATSGKLVIRTN